MYSFTSGTIVSAGTSSPSMPGTQPVSLNISLASFRRAIHSLGTALLMDGEAANWDYSNLRNGRITASPASNWGRVTIRTPLGIKLLNNPTCILIGIAHGLQNP